MAVSYKYPVPAIGTKGVYSLLSPFTPSPGEVLNCIAVRTLSSYIANNDDPLVSVYTSAGLTEDNYDEDLADNIQIVSLVNDKGYVYLVPARYIQSYPIQDGVMYRPLALSVALPLMPLALDLTGFVQDVKELVMEKLGVDCVTELVETGSPRAVDPVISQNVETEREMNATDRNTSYGRINALQEALAEAYAQIRVLEEYIVAKG